jgi:hypothetical protein
MTHISVNAIWQELRVDAQSQTTYVKVGKTVGAAKMENKIGEGVINLGFDGRP